MKRQTLNAAFVLFNWVLLIATVVAWVFAPFTWAKDEPQTVLHLSFLAIVVGAMGALLAAYVKKDVEP